MKLSTHFGLLIKHEWKQCLKVEESLYSKILPTMKFHRFRILENGSMGCTNGGQSIQTCWTIELFLVKFRLESQAGILVIYSPIICVFDWNQIPYAMYSIISTTFGYTDIKLKDLSKIMDYSELFMLWSYFCHWEYD